MTASIVILFPIVINVIRISELQGNIQERAETVKEIEYLIGPTVPNRNAQPVVSDISTFDRRNKNSTSLFPARRPRKQQIPYVVGGNNAPKGAYPYMVSIQRLKSHWCGGSIIHESWILTAAHCLCRNRPEEFNIEVGTNILHEGKKYRVLQMIPHENYEIAGEAFDDIGLIEVEKIDFRKNIKPIQLYKKTIVGGERCIVSGWGATNPVDKTPVDNLQHITVEAKSTDYCDYNYEYPMSEEEMCGFTNNTTGICSADSGGPLVIKRKKRFFQVGIVCRGIPCARGSPDVYTRTLPYAQWINDNCNYCMNIPT